MADIFISYKREERAIAKVFADALAAHGWTVWWDPALRAGERFDDVIEAAIREARCLIVLWSKLSVKSKYVKDESILALELGKLVPIAIEDVDLPFRFRSLHTLQVIGWDGVRGSAGHQSLVAAVQHVLGVPPILELTQSPPATPSTDVKPTPRPVDEGMSERASAIGEPITGLLATFRRRYSDGSFRLVETSYSEAKRGRQVLLTVSDLAKFGGPTSGDERYEAFADVVEMFEELETHGLVSISHRKSESMTGSRYVDRITVVKLGPK